MCRLLRTFPGCAAIKTTRGHYRSCGKDPHGCCVSELLGEHAVVRSGRDFTYQVGKDTGRYWDAGAVEVHWVIATDSQVDEGVREALGRVNTEVVFVEGNSFSQTVAPDFFVMVVRPDKTSIKPTARRALDFISALYVSEDSNSTSPTQLREFLPMIANLDPTTPMFSSNTFPTLVAMIRETLEKIRQPDLSEVHLKPA